MTEREATTDAVTEDFTEELSDEALDRGDGTWRYCACQSGMPKPSRGY